MEDRLSHSTSCLATAVHICCADAFKIPVLPCACELESGGIEPVDRILTVAIKNKLGRKGGEYRVCV